MVDKGNHRHFMAKEIYEQPETVSHTLSHYVDMAARAGGAARGPAVRLRQARRAHHLACGTAYYAGLVAKYWFEQLRRLPVDVDIASEFRYREPPLAQGGAGALRLAVGRDRRHAGGLRYCAGAGPDDRRAGQRPGIDHGAREPRWCSRRCAGPRSASPRPRPSPPSSRRSPASPIAAGVARGRSTRARGGRTVAALIDAPARGMAALAPRTQIAAIAKRLSKATDVLYLGRGAMFPIALEGALKLKEISYIHAEGYAAGELKHGPIALIDEADAGDRHRAARRALREDRSRTCRRWPRAAARSS